MRAFYAFFLILFLAAIGIFVAQNLETVTVKFLGGSWEIHQAILFAALYFLGMLTGWTVVGLVKKSLKRVTEHRAS